MITTSRRRHKALLAMGALTASAVLVLSGCGAQAGDDPTDAAAAESCVDTSGDTIKLGFLNSLTGGMAISEKTVSNVLHMAADEINADGGILGKQIEYVQEDGATDWPTFAEKTEKLLTQDCVAAIFGGWTSSSRKAVKPVVEEHNGLFFYPVQYEGLEASPNIYYTGATTNQQIIPALDFLAAEGVETLFLAGSDYVFPRTANAIIKLYAAELGIEIVGEEYVPLDKDDWTTQVAKIVEADPDYIFNTINGSSNVGFIKAYYDAGLTPETTPIISVSIAEEEAPAMGHEVTGNYASWNYFQSLDTPNNPGFIERWQAYP
ncbi:MAG TPA: transporter substrate-binding protein, partial [Pseudolysinimonas sp.]|nr:transporter substrate-binding protein [Pseudolysinimonas sp.]